MTRRLALLPLLLVSMLHGVSAMDAPPRLTARVTLAMAQHSPVSGRLILLMTPGEGKAQLEFGFLDTGTWVAAQEVSGLNAGQSVYVDLTDVAYPRSWASAPAGTYQVQAFLDRDHSFGYGGAGAGDLTAAPVTLRAFDPSQPSQIEVAMDHALPGPPTPEPNELVRPLHVPSAVMTRFLGQPTTVDGWVLLPAGYDAAAKVTYPTVYLTDGFGSTLASMRQLANLLDKALTAPGVPKMIWVLLDHSGPTGTHEFADSVNNGPWGTALITEVIPDLERHYRMDAKAAGRFVTGHSSGGWATLWLQVAYPTTFGGAWPTSPDPSDFTAFTGVNIYEEGANVYRTPDGAPRPLIRADGREVRSLQDFVRLEEVMGNPSGQFASFEWVFSPRGRDGRPVPLFDRHTGRVDRQVAEYWKTHFDIAEKITREWPRNGRHLRGKIHLTVGTADTIHLDDSARVLERRLAAIGADATFTYLPGKTHFDLFTEGDDRFALVKKHAAQMYAVARPSRRP